MTYETELYAHGGRQRQSTFGEGYECYPQVIIYNSNHSRGVAQPGSAPALGARSSLLKALLILTASNKSNNLGHLLFAQVKLQRPEQKEF